MQRLCSTRVLPMRRIWPAKLSQYFRPSRKKLSGLLLIVLLMYSFQNLILQVLRIHVCHKCHKNTMQKSRMFHATSVEKNNEGSVTNTNDSKISQTNVNVPPQNCPEISDSLKAAKNSSKTSTGEQNTSIGHELLDKKIEQNNNTSQNATSKAKRKYRKIVPLGPLHIPTMEEYVKYLTELCKQEDEQRSNVHHSPPLCPCTPDGIFGSIKVNQQYLLDLTWLEVTQMVLNNSMHYGGHWRPVGCTPRRKVAIIIPSRDREMHLRALLVHTIPIWQKQLVEFKVFVAEQGTPYLFNKATMMNIAFLESQKVFPSDCVLFHDVDLLEESAGNMLACGNNPTHMAQFIDRVSYVIPYRYIFGGGVLMKPQQFIKVNGFSNEFFGWGGEDDDFSNRVRLYGHFEIYRPPHEVSGYQSIKHIRDSANPLNLLNRKGFRTKGDKYLEDGVNSANFSYRVKEMKDYPLYTYILADILAPSPSGLMRGFERHNEPYVILNKSCSYSDMNVTKTMLTGNHSDNYSNIHIKSVSTCRMLCSNTTSCSAMEYHKMEEVDSFCILHHSTCGHLVEIPKNGTKVTLHIKKTHYEHFLDPS